MFMILGKKKNKKDYYTSGLEKYNAKKYLSAILFFQAALDNDPDNEDVLKMLAKTYGKTGNLGLQQQTLRKIQKNNPNICTSQKTTATSSNNSTLSCQSKYNRPSHIKRIWEWLSPDKTEIILRYILALFLFFLLHSSLNAGSWWDIPTKTALWMLGLTAITSLLMAWDSAETINRKYDSPLELFILLGFAIKYH
ncbi:MAG: tetratricopeptide repeat protein [Bacteroidales bacterium]|nr:tetratricopeptide repeat protein [Bacteroidales bacterium]